MSTTFNWIYLGTSNVQIDPIEGNQAAEDAGMLIGSSYGSKDDPLMHHVTSATVIDNGGLASVLDMDNTGSQYETGSRDQFITDTGSGKAIYTFDGASIYEATVTYTDGTKGNVTAVVAQDSTGHLFLAPEITNNADTSVYEANPIQSIALTGMSLGNTYTGLADDRYFTAYDDGYIDGTANADRIDSTFVEAAGGGSDKVDNNDAGPGSAGNDDIIRAGAGSDSIYSGMGNDTVFGGEGNDLTYGGDGADSVLGEAGDDALSGDAGNDTLSGGLGNDTVFGGNDDDLVTGDDGNDALYADGGNDQLFGGAGRDELFGGSNDDSLYGGTENDTLSGGAGNDLMDGGSGADTADYTGSTAAVNVTINGSNNAGGDAQGDRLTNVENLTGSAYGDTLSGDSGNNVLSGLAGNDLLRGGSGSDTITGEADNDTLFGGMGQDSLSGGDGNDVLDGGSGNDTLTGGVGQDHFQFENADGADRITDFSMDLANGQTADQLDVSGLANPDGSLLKSFDVAVADDGHGNAMLTFPGGESVVLVGVSPSSVASTGMLHSMGVPCFTAGTLIATPEGARLVESLAVGDLVLTENGPAPVIWCGHKRLDASQLAERPDLRPVRLKAGHYGLSKDLILSPQHAVKVQDVLIRARHLAEWGKGAHVARGIWDVTYHHILLPRHSLLFAQGAWAESFYPGAEGVRTLDLQDRVAIALAISAGQSFDFNDLRQIYGPRCLPLLSGKDVRLVASSPSGILGDSDGHGAGGLDLSLVASQT